VDSAPGLLRQPGDRERVAIGLILLVWFARRRAEIVAAIVGPTGLAGAFLGLTATRGMPLSLAERVGIALRMTTMLSCWLLVAAGVVYALRRSGAPRFAEAIGGGFALGVVYLATRAMLG
jgi:hypothetical protein